MRLGGKNVRHRKRPAIMKKGKKGTWGGGVGRTGMGVGDGQCRGRGGKEPRGRNCGLQPSKIAKLSEPFEVTKKN